MHYSFVASAALTLITTISFGGCSQAFTPNAGDNEKQRIESLRLVEATIRYRKAFVLRESGKFQEALEECSAAREIRSDRIDISAQVARLLGELGRFDEAMGALDFALENSPSYAAYSPFPTEEGFAFAQKHLGENAKNGFANYVLAKAEYNRGNKAKALQAVNICVDTHPNSTAALSFKWLLSEKTARRQVLDRILACDPSNARALWLAAVDEFTKKNYQAAKRLAESSYEVNSNLVGLTNLKEECNDIIGMVELIDQNESIARKHLEKNLNTSINMAFAIDWDDPSQTLKIIENLLSDRPESSFLICLRGGLLHELGKYNKSISIYLTAKRLAPSDWLPELGLGRAYMRLGDDALAIQHLRNAIEKGCEKPGLYSALARCERHINGWPSCYAAAKKAIDLQPEWNAPYWEASISSAHIGKIAQLNYYYTMRIGMGLSSSGTDFDATYFYAASAQQRSSEVESDPKNPMWPTLRALAWRGQSFSQSRAWGYRGAELYRKANADLNRALELENSFIAAQIWLAEFQGENGDYTMSVSEYDRALQNLKNLSRPDD